MRQSGFFISTALCLLYSTSLLAQVKETKLSSWFGLREIQCERYAPGAELDFMDYLEANEDYPEDEYLGFAWQTRWANHTELDLRFTLNSGWGLSGYELTIKHFPFPFLGLSAGAFRQSFYFRNYDQFLTRRDTGYYTDLRNGTNLKYHDGRDQGWQAGLVIPLSWKFLHLSVHLKGGVSSIVPFEEEFGQKRKQSNYRRDLLFKTKDSYNWFIYPKAALSVDLLRIRDTRIGFQAQAGWFVSNKFIDYDLTLFEWTYQSPQTFHVESPTHRLTKLDVDLGLYVTW